MNNEKSENIYEGESGCSGQDVPVGRFAPSPTGRMHLGNVMTAVVSWLSVKSRGGRWILRIEDLDPQRSKKEHSLRIEDDLQWLGLDWDEGGLQQKGPNGPYLQSLSGDIYEDALRRLEKSGETYPCVCTRADIMATQAPHQSDGRVIYGGTCLPVRLGGRCGDAEEYAHKTRPHAVRLHVPDTAIAFTDRTYGSQCVRLTQECGDFILRRGDGAWAYQLAVVADDARMGVTEVVRGNDLLLSAAQQIYLYGLLGYEAPEFAHLPLVCNSSGIRLSKRDVSLGMDTLRSTFTPEALLGRIACITGIRDTASPVSLENLREEFEWSRIRQTDKILL